MSLHSSWNLKAAGFRMQGSISVHTGVMYIIIPAESSSFLVIRRFPDFIMLSCQQRAHD